MIGVCHFIVEIMQLKGEKVMDILQTRQQPRSPIHTGRETTHTHTRVRGRLFSAFHCNINSNVMKLHSEIEFKLLQNNINDKIFSQAI